MASINEVGGETSQTKVVKERGYKMCSSCKSKSPPACRSCKSCGKSFQFAETDWEAISNMGKINPTDQRKMLEKRANILNQTCQWDVLVLYRRKHAKGYSFQYYGTPGLAASLVESRDGKMNEYGAALTNVYKKFMTRETSREVQEQSSSPPPSTVSSTSTSASAAAALTSTSASLPSLSSSSTSTTSSSLAPSLSSSTVSNALSVAVLSLSAPLSSSSSPSSASSTTTTIKTRTTSASSSSISSTSTSSSTTSSLPSSFTVSTASSVAALLLSSSSSSTTTTTTTKTTSSSTSSSSSSSSSSTSTSLSSPLPPPSTFLTSTNNQPQTQHSTTPQTTQTRYTSSMQSTTHTTQTSHIQDNPAPHLPGSSRTRPPKRHRPSRTLVAYMKQQQLLATGYIIPDRNEIHGRKIPPDYECVELTFAARNVQAPCILGDEEENQFLLAGAFFALPYKDLFVPQNVDDNNKLLLQPFCPSR